MKPKANPPTNPEARRNWDNAQHWKRTWHQRELEHSIIPETLHHWRPLLLHTFRTQGENATERLLKELCEEFENCAGKKVTPSKEEKGAIENMRGFVKALKALKRKNRLGQIKRNRKN